MSSNVVTYLFNPEAENALQHLQGIFDDYTQGKENIEKNHPLEKELDVMRSLSQFGYNGVNLKEYNGTVFISYTSCADAKTARTANPREEKAELTLAVG